MRHFLAFDLGASSGRAIVGSYENGKLELEEVHRFPNGGIHKDGHFRWDILSLKKELQAGLDKAAEKYTLDGCGIDTWGVDYALFDRTTGKLQELPMHYRDSRTEEIPAKLSSIISPEDLYARTGIQQLPFNTIYQLYAHKLDAPGLLERSFMLPMPDALGYLLGGEAVAEYTMSSTGALLNPKAREWDFELIDLLGLPREIFPKLVQPATQAGFLTAANGQRVPLIKVCSHDTASAVAAIPAVTGREFAYLSCGTWALLGAELAEPSISAAAAKASYTNEGGINHTIRFLTNIMGCWLLQECRRQWKEEGTSLSYPEMIELAKAAPSGCFQIDPCSNDFMAPDNMPARIQKAATRADGKRPETKGEILRCIYDSLSRCIADKLHQLEELRGLKYDKLYIVGGGTQDTLLMGEISRACGIPVLAGPIEATAIGNLMVQLLFFGELKSIQEGRQMIADCFAPVEY